MERLATPAPGSPVQAIFLDRDGVINRERADYVKNIAEFELLPGALESIRRLSTIGCPILVVTNQSAIGRQQVSPATVDAIHAHLAQLVKAEGGSLTGFLICPHHPDVGCTCRKPKPGLLLQAAQTYGLDLHQCIFVGDSVSDWQAAFAAGCPAILVQSGRHGPMLRQHLPDEYEVPVVADISAATNLILRRVGSPIL